MDPSAELLACLKEFTADGAIEIRENGGRVAPFAGLSWDVRVAAACVLSCANNGPFASPFSFLPLFDLFSCLRNVLFWIPSAQ